MHALHIYLYKSFCVIVFLPIVYCRDRDYERDKDRYRVEKEGYVPTIKLDYVDEHGRQMTPKEVIEIDSLLHFAAIVIPPIAELVGAAFAFTIKVSLLLLPIQYCSMLLWRITSLNVFCEALCYFNK